MASWAPVPAAATTPTGPGLTALAKPSPTPAEHRRSRARTHHQPATVERVVLERHLLVDGHVVAEQQDVQVGGQGLVGSQRGIVAGHRDHRDVGLPGCASTASRNESVFGWPASPRRSAGRT